MQHSKLKLFNSCIEAENIDIEGNLELEKVGTTNSIDGNQPQSSLIVHQNLRLNGVTLGAGVYVLANNSKLSSNLSTVFAISKEKAVEHEKPSDKKTLNRFIN